MALQDKQFVGWVLGIAGTVFVTGLVAVGRMLWIGNTTLVELTTKVATLETAVTNVQAAVVERSMDRYTGADAAKDRASLMELMSSIIGRNNDQDQQIMDLLKLTSRIEALLEKRP